jgi:multiple sugar transport system substrate-binding protein
MRNQAKGLAILAVVSAIALTACGSNAPNGPQQAANDGGGSANKGGKTVVTVSVPVSDRLIQQAEQLFEQTHPDIDIQVNSFSATPAGDKQMIRKVEKMGEENGEEQATIEKYRTSVNTAIMSGKADDLIAVQNLNYGAYAEKGLLADLAPYMEKDADFQSGAFNNKVLDAVKWDGRSYTLPINYTLNMIVGNEPVISKSGVKIDDKSWTWDQLFELGSKIAQADVGPTAIMSLAREMELFSAILQSTYHQYVDASAKKASFDSGNFAQLLTKVKDLWDQGLLRPIGENASDDVFKIMNVQGAEMLAFMPQTIYGGKGRTYETPGGGEGTGIGFTPGLMFAMNEQSKVKDAAWQFLQFLLSDQMQSMPGASGIAVRQSSMEQTLNSVKENLASGKMMIKTKNGNGEEVQQPAISDDDVKAALQIAAQAGTYIYRDPQVMNIAREEADAFFKGQRSAEEAAKSIQNRVMTYLNE